MYQVKIDVRDGNDILSATFVIEAPNMDMGRQAATRAMAQLGFDGDEIRIGRVRALETSEGELGYWTQGDNGPVWTAVENINGAF